MSHRSRPSLPPALTLSFPTYVAEPKYMSAASTHQPALLERGSASETFSRCSSGSASSPSSDLEPPLSALKRSRPAGLLSGLKAAGGAPSARDSAVVASHDGPQQLYMPAEDTVELYAESPYRFADFPSVAPSNLGRTRPQRPLPEPKYPAWEYGFNAPATFYELFNPLARTYGYRDYAPHFNNGPRPQPAPCSPIWRSTMGVANGLLRTVQCLMEAAALACLGLLVPSAILGEAVLAADLLICGGVALGGLVLVGGLLALLARATRRPVY